MYSCQVKFNKLICLTFYPFFLRTKVGEGGIVLFNVAHTWFATKNILQTGFSAILSIMMLCVLYGFNDYIDRKRDAQNPKKNQQFVALINEFHKQFLLLNLFLSSLLLLCVFLFIGNAQAFYLLFLLAINAFYSLRIKAVPFADLVIVTIWGAAIILCMPVVNLELSLFAGIMTGIAHVFQMLSDKETDKLTNVNTTVARFPKSVFAQIFILCILLAFSFFYFQKNILLAATAMLPLTFYYIIRKNELAWLLSRVYFSGVWLFLLYKEYGGL